MTDVSSTIANETSTKMAKPIGAAQANGAASASQMSAEEKIMAGQWLSPEELAELPAFAISKHPSGAPQGVASPEEVEVAGPAEEQADELAQPAEESAQIGQLEVHPYARLFPLMEGEELEALVADIEANGLREPITLDARGRIVDGRNRARACEAARVAPQTTTLSIDDDEALLSWIISCNMHRRHLTVSQRAAIAADIANLRQGRKPANWPVCASQAQAAKAMKVSERSVRRAAAVKKSAPELHADMKAGRISTNAALKQIPKPEPTPIRLNEDDLYGATNALFEFDLWCQKYRQILAETPGMQAHADAILKALRARAS